MVIDLETFWSDTHTLKKMNPVNYALHPDTEIQSCSFTLPGKETFVVFGEDQIRAVLQRLPAHRVMAIGHNMAMFDSMLLNWRLGFEPAVWGCTMAMARPTYGKVCNLSLDALLKHLEAPITKGSLEATNTKGKRLADFTPAEVAAMSEYNKIDGDGCMWLFKKLLPTISKRELQVIDMTVRMLLDKKLQIDVPLLERTAVAVAEEKRQSLLDVAGLLGVEWEDEAIRLEEVRSRLASAPKFTQILEHYGFEVPMKVSPSAAKKGQHKLIPALSKTDDAMQELVECDHPVVSACAAARLGVKSTQLESRIQTFLGWAAATGGGAPMPLHYCGAEVSGRWSGAFKANVQNLPQLRFHEDGTAKHGNALRACLKAPPGYKVVVADLSGIELRVNHFLWKEPESVALFNADPEADLYKAFAAARYGVDIDNVTKSQRQMGKVSHLGLGFGAGAKAFRIFAKQQFGLIIDEIEAEDIVNAWRAKYHRIVTGWRTCDQALADVYHGLETQIDPWGLCHTTAGGITLPSGRHILYPSLHNEPDTWPDGRVKRGGSWWYGQGRHRARITGPKTGQNIVQALARDVITDCALEFTQRTGVFPSNTVHDELILVVPEAEAEGMLDEMQSIMRTPPSWWPELVTWSEGAIGDRYSDAK